MIKRLPTPRARRVWTQGPPRAAGGTVPAKTHTLSNVLWTTQASEDQSTGQGRPEAQSSTAGHKHKKQGSISGVIRGNVKSIRGCFHSAPIPWPCWLDSGNNQDLRAAAVWLPEAPRGSSACLFPKPPGSQTSLPLTESAQMGSSLSKPIYTRISLMGSLPSPFRLFTLK